MNGIKPYGGSLDFNCNGIAGCIECGWRGVPTFVNDQRLVRCPVCDIGVETIEYWDFLHKTLEKKMKIGRNDPCTCGSGKKYKKCCGK